MIRGDLAVRINDGRIDRDVSRLVSDLSFGSVAPGGHAAVTFKLDAEFDDFQIDSKTKVYVYDTRTTETLCEGYAEDPGRENGSEGEGFDVAAYGGSALATDQSEKLIYLDTAYDAWRQDDLDPQAPSGTATVGNFPEGAGVNAGEPGLYVQFVPGQPIGVPSQVGMVYDAFADSSMTLGAFFDKHDSGLTDPNYHLEWVAHPYLGEGLVGDETADGLAHFVSWFVGVTIPAAKTGIVVRLIRRGGGATNIATDTVWATFGAVRVLGHRMDRYGALVTMDRTTNVLAHEVVADLLGRVLTFCDPVSARIDTATFQIDQLVYHDGARAKDVLDDLSLFEPDFVWEILESNAAGLYRFNYRAWDTDPRYELSTEDGYSQPGSEADLVNRMAVYWTDTKGQPRVEVVTSDTVVRGGGIKDAESIDLGNRVGSAANATRIGEQVLAAQNAVSRAATARVSRDIVDRYTGCVVKPWELKAGYPALVRETGDLLRITETSYRDAEETMTLTLGTPARTRDQIVADLTGRRNR